jgi:hypothetical protein
MLAFGRGLFTASVLSTFIILIISFYPADIDDMIALNQLAKPTIAHNTNTDIIELDKIKKICETFNIQLMINKIILEPDNILKIQYKISNKSSDYGFIDSYNLASLLFDNYAHLNSISYTVILDNKPFLNATITNDKFMNNFLTQASNNILYEIQKSFSIILLEESLATN